MTHLSPETFESAKLLDKLDQALLKHLAYVAFDPTSSKRDAERARKTLSARCSQRVALAMKYPSENNVQRVQIFINGRPEPPVKPKVREAES